MKNDEKKKQENTTGRELFLSIDGDEVIPERMMDDIEAQAEEGESPTPAQDQ